ncbi:MAG: universal stress protein [Deltaproteobacteria bacterium]|nr:universal stress protein [Deltaproteobacteria bacterium]
MSRKQHILIPVDFSNISLEAVNAARDLSFPDTEITLLHVYDITQDQGPATRDIAPPQKGLPKEVEKQLLDSLKRIRESRLGDVKEVNLNIEISRFPAKAICQFAERELVDLIVITTHGRTGLSHIVMGSVAEDVVRKAPCPVLVMRKRKVPTDSEKGKIGPSSEKQSPHFPL